MQSFKCVIVDDEPIATKYLTLFVEQISELELVKTFFNPLEALDYLEKEQIDVVFLDIQMPQMSGIEIAKKISNKSLFIFTTAYAEYAVEGFDLAATDYLLKPISFDRFLKASNKAIEILKLKTQAAVVEREDFKRDFMFVKANFKLVKINYADILVFEGCKEYIKIITKEGKPIITLESMKNIEQIMPKSDFIRVHKSYIISTKNISAIAGNIIEMGEIEIPIGATYKDALMEYLKT